MFRGNVLMYFLMFYLDISTTLTPAILEGWAFDNMSVKEIPGKILKSCPHYLITLCFLFSCQWYLLVDATL
jgi:hypothetical protein